MRKIIAIAFCLCLQAGFVQAEVWYSINNNLVNGNSDLENLCTTGNNGAEATMSCSISPGSDKNKVFKQTVSTTCKQDAASWSCTATSIYNQQGDNPFFQEMLNTAKTERGQTATPSASGNTGTTVIVDQGDSARNNTFYYYIITQKCDSGWYAGDKFVGLNYNNNYEYADLVCSSTKPSGGGTTTTTCQKCDYYTNNCSSEDLDSCKASLSTNINEASNLYKEVHRAASKSKNDGQAKKASNTKKTSKNGSKK